MDLVFVLLGFHRDLPDHKDLADWYRPHIEAWSKYATPTTTLWFWNSEIGWATVHSTVSYYYRGLALGLPMDRSQPRLIREAFLILRAWGNLSMPRHQWIVLLVIVLVPVFIFPILPLWKTVGPFCLPEFLPLWKTVGPFDLPIKYPTYGLWGIFALVLVPEAFRQDRSRAEQSINVKLKGPKRDIQRLKDELEQMKTDLQEQKEQLAETYRVMQIGFAEADVTLPLRPMPLRASVGLSAPQIAFVTLHTRAAKLVRWVKSPAHRFWKWFWG